MVSLGNQGSVEAVSADGSVLVGVSQGEAYRWTEETGVVTLGILPKTFYLG